MINALDRQCVRRGSHRQSSAVLRPRIHNDATRQDCMVAHTLPFFLIIVAEDGEQTTALR